MGIGLLIGLVVLPMYVSNLLKIREGMEQSLKQSADEMAIINRSLDKEKEKAEVTLHSIGDGVIATDRDGQIEMLNTVSEGLTGWKQEEAQGKLLNEVFRIFRKGEGNRLECPAMEAIRSRKVVSIDRDAILESRDGSRKNVEDSCAPIFDNTGELIGTILVFRDITEQKRLEEEVIRAHKLDSIGVLAGGIAHDFNNLLSAILGNISIAQTLISDNMKVGKRLHDAEIAGLRAKDLAQRLLTFSKGGAPIRTMASISEIVQETLDFALRGTNVAGSFKAAADLWTVHVDPAQIGQVVQNLVINSVQAMPNGGFIFVTARNVVETGETKYVRAGEYVVLEVSDNGPGIPPAVLPRVFDPYFSTKEKGSGLGLATAYRIMKNHCGNIFASSSSEGSTFTLYLPGVKDVLIPEPAETIPEFAHEGKKEAAGEVGRVLIMDDEDLVREMLASMLEMLGYTVDGAEDGRKALELYRTAKSQGGGYDFIVTDLTVPGGMGGRELLRNLQEEFGEVRAVVSSGYSSDPVMSDYKKYGFLAIMPKPYRFEDVKNIITQLKSTSMGSCISI